MLKQTAERITFSQCKIDKTILTTNRHLNIKKRGRLFGGTVPPKNFLFGRTVPPNNFLFGGTVPPNNFLFGGTCPAK